MPAVDKEKISGAGEHDHGPRFVSKYYGIL